MKLSHNLFVYGTLKRGFYNYNTYLRHAVAQGSADYRGAALTCGGSSLCMTLQGPRHVPAVSKCPTGNGKAIRGEVYAISDTVLQAMDLIEGVARGFYERQSQRVQFEDGTEGTCWIYLQNHDDDKDVLECLSEYTSQLHQRYVPPSTEPDPEILQLLVQSQLDDTKDA